MKNIFELLSRRWPLLFVIIVTLCLNADLHAGNVTGEDVDQAEAVGLHDYKINIASALAGDEAGLRQLLRLAPQHKFDGAGAESYTTRLGYLLKRWGDHRFAAVLRTESTVVRKEVIRHLDEYAVDKHMRRYPETSSLSEHRITN
jgi:hypothetical protein